MVIDFRSQFNLDDSLIYLNSGTLSITPKAILNAVSRYQKEYEANPTRALMETWKNLWEIQKLIGDFFQANPHELFLRPNVTSALNDFLMGIPLPSQSEILTSDLEYGAIVNICKLRAQRDHLSLRSFHIPTSTEWVKNITEDKILNLILASLSPKTKLLLISHVITGTGLVIPIERLALETKKQGILLAVDGAHAPGAVEVNFKKLKNVDFYGGNLHKWMMGPKGTAFGWIPKKLQSTLNPITGGWTTFDIPLPFKEFGEEDPLTARSLISCCNNFAPFFALKETLDFWRENGKEAIQSKIFSLQNILEKEMSTQLGWPCLSPPSGALRGPLITFDMPDHLEKQGFGLMDTLFNKHRLQVMVTPVQGRFRLRLSPHIYNTESELIKALKILREF